MTEFISQSSLACILITFLSYWIGDAIHKKWPLPVLNPLLVAIILSAGCIYVLHLSPDEFSTQNKSLNLLLTPATVCLALPLYEQYQLLKKNFRALCIGITGGVIANGFLIFILAKLFHLDQTQFITLLPKSVTTAIGLAISEELGRIVPVTVIIIAFTGVLGNVSARAACRLCRITEPLAQGIGIGTASHVIGTSKALEINETAGAASSLSIALAGILTALFAPLLAGLY